MRCKSALIPLLAGLGASGPLLAQSTPAAALDHGDTAWMLTSSMLVLLMTIPGLALFYGGMVRAKNLLSVLMQCFSIVALVSVLWVLYGYSVAFSTVGMTTEHVNLHAIVGGLDRVFLAGLTPDSLYNTIPESVFVMFQMTFAIITPALIIGAFAERMKFSALLWFTALWVTVVYLPMAHMVWSGPGSLLGDMGVIDFAGGTVVHINAGIAGLVACLMIGKRRGYPTTAMPPHNLGYTVIGASMLWLGWFGFNAGSAAAANGSAGMAMLVTQVATAAAAIGWTAAEWMVHKRASVLGIVSGAVAGLVAVTPAAGTAGPGGALVLGLVTGVICYFTATRLKYKLGYDDTLDVFGVHAVAGIVGALLTGPLAAPALGGFGTVADLGGQLWIQAKGVGFTVLWSGVLTWLILLLLDKTLGLRVSTEQEQIGLDLAEHEERAYNL
ncbi:ammonium transporter [Frateuria aurantia]|uniref:Ammonium transporter n=1 Tax=Frateuria aurantia (strain ATCC 33424 / DSM 6220 / KCTC 2777 / LMG 1558 / NBRC 3245 / NCIMB 13370) TaxID=767434 RepID=H8L2Q4_FRAAD|nr:ammonium transporter [Frateuria aurantia]AFC86413.1 ammonium transporter [Frateuria aurantia DSM 6220]